MARIRSIKPDFWDDEKIGSLSRDARLLFIGLWNHADDEGRMRANARYVKSKVFPYDDDVDTGGLLAEIACLRLIRLYKIGGQEYLWIVNFKKHQRIDKPQPSALPECPAEYSDSIPGPFEEHSENGTAWSGEGEGMEGEEDGEVGRVTAPHPLKGPCHSWENVRTYFTEGLGRPEEAQPFFDAMESRGWKTFGKNPVPVADYHAEARKWIRNADRFASERELKNGTAPPGLTLEQMAERELQSIRRLGI